MSINEVKRVKIEYIHTTEPTQTKWS